MTVKMQKGDKFADVHPDEVENYQLGGYVVADKKATPKTEETETLYDIYKVVDGQRAKRVSRANLTKAEAEIWVKGRDDEYTLVVSE